MFVVVFQTSKISSMKEIENKISKLFLLLSFQCNENEKSNDYHEKLCDKVQRRN